MSHNCSPVLPKAPFYGIPVERDNSCRAWLKAASLFVEYYVMPVICKAFSQVDHSRYLDEILCNLVKYLHHYSNTPENKCERKYLPTHKRFISIKKLFERHKGSYPTHSQIYQESYCNSEQANLRLLYNDWSEVPYLLIGVLQSGKSLGEPIMFSDLSGSIPIHSVDMFGYQIKHISTVSLFTSWNFIPIQCHDSSFQGYVEALELPVILATLDSNISSVGSGYVQLVNNDIPLTIDSLTENMQEISGRILRVENIDGTIAIKLDTQLHTSENFFLSNCTPTSDDIALVSIRLNHPWLIFAFCGLNVKITKVMKKPSISDHQHWLYCTTLKSDMFVLPDANDLLQQYRSRMNQNASEGSDILHSVTILKNVCSVYVGQITNIKSNLLRILSLDSKVDVVLTYVPMTDLAFGIRVGAIIAIKMAHVCKTRDRIVLVCCKSSTLHVLQHSQRPTPYNNFINKNESEFIFQLRTLNPVKCLSLLPSVFRLTSLFLGYDEENSNDFHQAQKVDFLKQLFVETIVKGSSKKVGALPVLQTKSLKFYQTCSVQGSLQVIQRSFHDISLNAIRSMSIAKAKEQFEHTPTFNWTHTILYCDELIFPASNSCWNEDHVLVSKLQLCVVSSCLQLWDGDHSLPCVLLEFDIIKAMDNIEVKNMLELESFQRECSSLSSIPCSKYIDSIVRLLKFAVIVERTYSTECDDSSNEKNVFKSSDEGYKYLVYIVVCVNDLNLFKSSEVVDVKELKCKEMILEEAVPHSEKIQDTCIIPSNSRVNSLSGGTNCEKSEEKFYSLLFVIHKSQLQSFPGKTPAFSVVAFRYSESSSLQECYWQLHSSAVKWYEMLYPGLLVEATASWEDISKGCNDQSDHNKFDVKKCSLKNCDFTHIHSVAEVHMKLNKQKVQEFYCDARESWKRSYFAKGLEWVYSVDDVVTCPSFSSESLITVRGQIVSRLQCSSGILVAEQNNIRINIVTTGKCTLSVYMSSHASDMVKLGLIPGAVVDFYRVKVVLSNKSHIYCKFTPTSFFIVRSIITISSGNNIATGREYHSAIKEMTFPDILEPGDVNPCSTNVLWRTVPVSTVDLQSRLLYDVYAGALSTSDQQAIKLKVFLTRLLKVEINACCPSCQQNLSSCLCVKHNISSHLDRSRLMNDKPSERLISFYARCIVSDGSGRALLHFGSNKQGDFCKLTGIKRSEWDQLIALIFRHKDISIRYDCDLYHGKEMFSSLESSSKNIAQCVAVQIFNDINSRCLVAQEIFISLKLPSNKKEWTCTDGHVDENLSCVDEKPDVQTMFKIGTVAVEDGDNSLRSLSIRLLEFNCVSVT